MAVISLLIPPLVTQERGIVRRGRKKKGGREGKKPRPFRPGL